MVRPRASVLRSALADLGVRPTDRVAFYVSTSEASVTTYFACQLLGAVTVPVNFRLAPGEVAHILNNSGARVLVYGRQLAANALAATALVRTVHDCISCADDPDDVPAGHHHFEHLAEQTAGRGEALARLRPTSSRRWSTRREPPAAPRASCTATPTTSPSR